MVDMAGPVPFPEPTSVTGDTADLLVRQLAFYRSTVLDKVGSLDEAARRRSRVPSGWTPMGLAVHLAYMEHRWIVWGFLGELVERPWGDHDPERPGSWVVPDALMLDDVASWMRENGTRTEEVLTTTPLDARAALGGRFYADPPTLGSIGVHVLGEYARHAGHLDVAVELAGGPIGE